MRAEKTRRAGTLPKTTEKLLEKQEENWKLGSWQQRRGISRERELLNVLGVS